MYEQIKDHTLTLVIAYILKNRRFYVSFQNRNSRWRNQKNGLAQGSMLAPILNNIYSNDQPNTADTRHFKYTDDTAIAAQANSFQEVEQQLTTSLEALTTYYEENHLRLNPQKTQVCAFYLKNWDATRKLNIKWQGKYWNIVSH